ncbi:unnamed protein product [Triticum turgidum subsp. durum]|uniref:Uncharacterized protein n=1 Tax=Triticum turgidum subsp. durum TaxID=4567 RepID=A0A9R0SLE2_TRITD|nr:unnamed protein product [Triticum turgidum subsp. durum]
MANTTSSTALLIALVVLAGLADLHAATADPRPVHASELSVPAWVTGQPMTAPELEGMMECMMGCWTTVMGCVFGCVAKPPADMPLCWFACDQTYVMGMAMVAVNTTMEHSTELDGKMQCMMGCFTTVMICAFKCMIPCVIACPTLPLCITNCDLKTVGCMFRCGTAPLPPKPKPKPKPPAPPGLQLDAHDHHA